MKEIYDLIAIAIIKSSNFLRQQAMIDLTPSSELRTPNSAFIDSGAGCVA